MIRKILVINPENCMEVQFDQQITIGRDVFNSLSLKDPEVSRSHAIIFEQESEVIIKDLKSRNGVYVNGEQVAESALRPGDEIIVGASVLIFDPPEDLDLEVALSRRGRYLIEKRSESVGPEREAAPTSFTITEMEGAIRALFADEGEGTSYFTVRNAIYLLEALKAMDDAAEPAELFEVALRRALGMLGGHRGVVMETDETKQHLKVRSIISVDQTQTILIAQPVLQIVMGEEKCVFCTDVHKDSRFGQIATQSKRPVHGFVAAPILGRDELFGFIYCDSEDRTTTYDFSALRSLYFIASHMGALLRTRPMHFSRHATATTAAERG